MEESDQAELGCGLRTDILKVLSKCVQEWPETILDEISGFFPTEIRHSLLAGMKTFSAHPSDYNFHELERVVLQTRCKKISVFCEWKDQGSSKKKWKIVRM